MPSPQLQAAVSLQENDDRPTILNKPILEEIWRDMAATTKPSWLANPPKNLGSASHGKLSADQWRTACSVNMVITLIRLWGSTDSTQHQRDILDNFLALVATVRWATMRTASRHQIQIVDEQMQAYLTSLVRLFSDKYVRINHHLTLHLAECLRRFGPVHGWWAFPFERYNGIIRGENINNKFGEPPACFHRIKFN